VKVDKSCRELAVVIGFKLGMSGEMIVATQRHVLSNKPLHPEEIIKAELLVNTLELPSSLYDLYIWLGPIQEIALDEYYDIADTLVTPIRIFENKSTTQEDRTKIISTIEIL
jgi:hypothetical protein